MLQTQANDNGEEEEEEKGVGSAPVPAYLADVSKDQAPLGLSCVVGERYKVFTRWALFSLSRV